MSEPIKESINYLIRFKCAVCKDNAFCKLKYYYTQIDNLQLKDLQNLNKCLFYKKVS